jgi:hypothetical protein
MLTIGKINRATKDAANHGGGGHQNPSPTNSLKFINLPKNIGLDGMKFSVPPPKDYTKGIKFS